MHKEQLKKYLKIFVTSVVYLERKQIFSIYTLTFVLFCVIFFYFKVFPSMMKIKENKEMIGDLVKSIEVANKRVQGYKVFKRKLKDIDAVFFKNRKIFIEKGEVQVLVSMVAEYGDEAGVDFIEFNPLPSKKIRFFSEIPLSVSIKGGFSEIYEFIGKIAGGLCLISFDKIKISSKGSKQKLSVQCILKGYGIDEL